MRQEGVEQIQTAIRGRKPSDDRLGLDNFDWDTNAEGQPQRVACPHGQSVMAMPGRKADRFRAAFQVSDCGTCPFLDQCPTYPLKCTPERVLRFSQQEMDLALRRKRSAEALATGCNLRSAVEATVHSVKHPFPNGQVPVRGRPRVWMVLIGSAAMSNVRSKIPFRVRIFRYQASKSSSKANKGVQKGPKTSQEQPITSTSAALWARILSMSLLQPAFVFSC